MALDSQRIPPASAEELPVGGKSPDLVQAERVVWRLSLIEFPWDINKALEFALLRTYAVPAISSLLARTGEFTARTEKRYDDTALLIREVLVTGLDAEGSLRAFARINDMHGRFRIADEDFLYVLSTFVFSPIEWLDAYGRRALSADERRDWFVYWREFGRRMGITDIPESLQAFHAFVVDYERRRYAPSPANLAIAHATIDLVLSHYWTPRVLRPIGRRLVAALCAPQLVEALGIAKPSGVIGALAVGGLKLRRAILRLLPPRSTVKTIHFGLRTYPEGFNIEELGTFRR